MEFLEGDLADPRSRTRAVGGVDYVLHQAAIPSVPRSVKDPITSNRANIDAALSVLVAARDAGVKRVVYAGSSSVYGNTPTLPKREDMPPNPLSPYALQKLVAEQYLPDVHAALWAGDGDDPLLQRLRPAAGSRFALLWRDFPLLVRAACRTAPRLGDGEQTRDFTYVANVVNGVLLAPNAERRRRGNDESCDGRRISLNDLVRVLNAIIGSSSIRFTNLARGRR